MQSAPHGGGHEMSSATQTGAGGAARFKASPRTLFLCGIFGTCTHPTLSPTPTPNHNHNVVPACGGGDGGGGTKGGSGTPCASADSAASAATRPRLCRGNGSTSERSSSSTSRGTSCRCRRLPPCRRGGFPSLAEEKFATGEVMEALAGVVAAMREPSTARLAAKVLMVVLLEEANMETAVEAGAASVAMEAVAASGLTGAMAERALAALELLCTAPDGAPAVRREALTAPVLARAVEGMAGCKRECAIGVLAAIYGGAGGGGGSSSSCSSPPPPSSSVVKVVAAAMQGECSARGRRKRSTLEFF